LLRMTGRQVECHVVPKSYDGHHQVIVMLAMMTRG
jgi:hypothetical protein